MISGVAIVRLWVSGRMPPAKSVARKSHTAPMNSA